MYEQPWEKQQKLDEQAAREVRDLVSYLAHANKSEHLKTAMRLVDSLARIESSVSWLTEEHRGKVENRHIDGSVPPDLRPQFIELPLGTRKVSIEL